MCIRVKGRLHPRKYIESCFVGNKERNLFRFILLRKKKEKKTKKQKLLYDN